MKISKEYILKNSRRWAVYGARLGLASALAIYAAHIMGLQFETQAGVICIFSMLTTSKDTLRLSVSRLISFIITAISAFFLFQYVNEFIAYGIFIFITIYFSEMMGWGAALSANVVAGTHFLSVPEFTPAVIINEFFGIDVRERESLGSIGRVHISRIDFVALCVFYSNLVNSKAIIGILNVQVNFIGCRVLSDSFIGCIPCLMSCSSFSNVENVFAGCRECITVKDGSNRLGANIIGHVSVRNAGVNDIRSICLIGESEVEDKRIIGYNTIIKVESFNQLGSVSRACGGVSCKSSSDSQSGHHRKSDKDRNEFLHCKNPPQLKNYVLS